MNEDKKIKWPDRKQQIIDLTTLSYGKSAMPTDMDGLFEKNDRLFIFFEFKYMDAEMPEGQETAYTRVVNALQEAGRVSAFFLCRHNVHDTRKEVNAATAIVDKYFYHRKWYSGNGKTVRQVMDEFYYDFIVSDWRTIGVSTMYDCQDGFLSVSEITAMEEAH